MHIPRPRRTPKTQPDKGWPSKQALQKEVKRTVKTLGLDPTLPEILRLMDLPDSMWTSSFAEHPMLALQTLDPNYEVHIGSEGELQVGKVPSPTGRTLMPRSLVHYHWPKATKELTRIVADADGTHLFRDNQEVMNLVAGAIHPRRRLSDAANRYWNPCAIIQEFTGFELDWQGPVKSITATKSEDKWAVKFEALD